MFIKLKKGFEIMEHGVQAGYWDNDKKKAVQVARVFPGKPEKVSDKEGALVIEGYECFEETKSGSPYKVAKPGAPEEVVESVDEEEPQTKKKGAKK